MDGEQIKELSKLIKKFKIFLFCSIKENNKIDEDKKDKIHLLLDKFINEHDVYGFKNIISILIKNKQQFLNQMNITENEFNNNRQKKYYQYIDLFKSIYSI